jgi:ABC-2 type transport system permease protein
MSTFLTLYRQRLRRDRWQLAIWVITIGLLALLSVTTILKSYGDEASRAEVLRLATATPAILMLRGLVRGASEGAFTFFALFAFISLLAGFMSTFLAVRHSRAEEESGRAELVSATPAGRWTPLAATVFHGLVANVFIAVALFLGLTSGGLEPSGSLVAGAAAGSVGIAFLGIGLLSAEFMSTSRGANGIASALAALAYLLRGFGDATGQVSQDGLTITAAWPSWLSPIGWGQQTFAYTGNRLWPITLPLALGAACIAAVLVLMSRRDVGASVVAGRASRADARASLRGPFSLALRLQQGAIIGWCLGGLMTGLLAGALGSAVQHALNGAPSITSALRAMIQARGTSMTQLVISVLFEFAGVLAAACCLQAIIRLRQEETAGTAALVVAQPLSRVHLLASFLALGAVSVVLVMAFAAVGAWASLAASGDTSSAVTDVWQTAADQIPAALIYLALPAAAFVLWPGSTMPLGWGTLILGVMIGLYGGMIGLDKSVRDLSPFTHTPVPSPSGSDWTGGFWMLGIAGALTAVALIAMRRREIGDA